MIIEFVNEVLNLDGSQPRVDTPPQTHRLKHPFFVCLRTKINKNDSRPLAQRFIQLGYKDDYQRNKDTDNKYLNNPNSPLSFLHELFAHY